MKIKTNDSAYGVEHGQIYIELDRIEKRLDDIQKQLWNTQIWHCNKCGGNFDRWHYNCQANMCDKCLLELKDL